MYEEDALSFYERVYVAAIRAGLPSTAADDRARRAVQDRKAIIETLIKENA